MAFVIETGAGTPNANAYATTTFVDAYLTDLGRETENSWSSATSASKQESIVTATFYIDLRFGGSFKGSKANQSIAGREATGTLTIAALPNLTEVVVVGAVTYKFVDALVDENDVLRGSTVTDSAANLVTALSGGDGVVTHLDTQENYEATGSSVAGVITIEAISEGLSGNAVVFTTTVTGATITGSGTLTGGLDGGPQPLEFPRRNLHDASDVLVIGIPWKLRAATAEYAVRSLAGSLASDPTVDATGVAIKRKREKVGPIEEETEYISGAIAQAFPSYPLADSLLAEYLRAGALAGGGGGLIRG